MNLTNSTLQEVAYSEIGVIEELRIEVLRQSVVDDDRWNIYKETIFSTLNDGKFWRLDWHRGATEYQDYDSFDNGDWKLTEVVQIKKVIIDYEEVV